MWIISLLILIEKYLSMYFVLKLWGKHHMNSFLRQNVFFLQCSIRFHFWEKVTFHLKIKLNIAFSISSTYNWNTFHCWNDLKGSIWTSSKPIKSVFYVDLQVLGFGYVYTHHLENLHVPEYTGVYIIERKTGICIPYNNSVKTCCVHTFAWN